MLTHCVLKRCSHVVLFWYHANIRSWKYFKNGMWYEVVSLTAGVAHHDPHHSHPHQHHHHLLLPHGDTKHPSISQPGPQLRLNHTSYTCSTDVAPLSHSFLQQVINESVINMQLFYILRLWFSNLFIYTVESIVISGTDLDIIMLIQGNINTNLLKSFSSFCVI